MTVLVLGACAILLLAAVLALVVGHFLPLLLNPGAPRGSFGWPLVGETLGFLRPHASNTPGSFLQDHISRYGAVFSSHLFGAPTVVSCDEELNHFVLQNEERLFQCSYPGTIHGILGKSSMLVVTGEHHRRVRNLFLALVASTRPSPTYLADVEGAARAVVASWRGRHTVASCHEARKFAFGVIVKQVLGMSPDEPAAGSILEDYLTFMKGLVSFPLCIPGTPYAKAVKARRRISCTLESIFEDRRKGGSSKKSGFLSVLLSSNEYSHEEKVSFVLDSLLAGYETTSVLISIIVYFLGQSSKCLDQLKREHQCIRSSKGKEEFLNAEDYMKMEYTQHVINEALRCGNVVKFLHRKALKNVRYKEYLIPSGWKVLPIFSAVHLDPSLHVNPQQFQPCRWEGPNFAQLHEHSFGVFRCIPGYLRATSREELNHFLKGLNQTTGKKFTPFGGGARLCPGSELGKVEVAFFLHHLVLNYRWRMDGEDAPMAYPYVEFERGLPIEIEPI